MRARRWVQRLLPTRYVSNDGYSSLLQLLSVY